MRARIHSRRLTAVVLLLSMSSMGAMRADAASMLVAVPVATSPVVAVRLMFTVGSIHDPAGKEGLAALTGLMIGQAGTSKRDYNELVTALYPMAASISVNTDREVTVISGNVHQEKLTAYTALLQEAVLDPGFRDADLERNREQLLGYLTATLRSGNDELLGLEAIQQRIFAGHPYAHSPAGTIQGLEHITMADVKAFYAAHFTQANLMLGIAGGYPHDYAASLQRALTRLPAGKPGLTPLPTPPPPKGRVVTIVEKETASVGVHFGYPLALNRADPDFYPLMVANSFLGEHRTMHGRLMNELRGLRGLNYGDYSYIEYWDNPPGTSNPPPNVPRRQQYFSVWVRPVAPDHAHFALRNAIAEVDRLVAQGMTQEEFTLTRDFLVSYSKLWARSLSDRLGFALDSRFYGTPYFINEIDQRLKKLTLDEVNRAIRKYLQTTNMEIVLVAPNAAALKRSLEEDKASPMTYANPIPETVTKADASIQVLKVAPATVSVVPVASMFEK